MDMRAIVHPKDELPMLVGWPAIQRQYEWYSLFGEIIHPAQFLEIGVAAGYSSYAILEGCERAGVKPFVTWIDFCDGHGWDGNHDYAHGLIRGRYGIVPDDRVMNSRKIEGFDRKFDLVHIDGDHTYDGCLYDLNLTSKHLADEGCIICHDAHDEWVSKAIDYFDEHHAGFRVLNVPQVRCGVRIIYRRSSDIVNRLWEAILKFGS